MDFMTEIERAKATIDEAMSNAQKLAAKLPDGHTKLAALTLVSQLVSASVILSIRRPAVPCRLDFLAVDQNIADGNARAGTGARPIITKLFELPAVGGGEMAEQEMLDRIKLLADEMDANDEENCGMQSEIDTLYAKIDAAKELSN